MKTTDTKQKKRYTPATACAGWGVLMAVCTFFTSCVDDPIYDTPHPEYGKITLTTDWSYRTAGIDIPATLTAAVGKYSAQLPATGTATFPNLIEPGTYRLDLYNTTAGITVNGTTATADYNVAGGLGWFFTWTTSQVIERDKDYPLTAVMQQQVRPLTLVIEPTGGATGRIASIAAILTGVASQLDFGTGAHSTPVSVQPVFARQTDGTYTATLRLLGTADSTPQLSVTVSFAGNNPLPVSVTHDLSTLLSTFNSDKRNPLTLNSQVVETPTEAGVTATITPWEQATGSGIAQ